MEFSIPIQTPQRHFSIFHTNPSEAYLNCERISLTLSQNVTNLDSESLCNLLLYGSSNLNMIDNRIIIEAKTEYIEETDRLN